MIPLFKRYRVPEFDTSSNDVGLGQFLTIDGTHGMLRRLKLVPLESSQGAQRLNQIRETIEGLSIGVRARFKLSASHTKTWREGSHSRIQSIQHVGHVEKKLHLALESTGPIQEAWFDPIRDCSEAVKLQSEEIHFGEPIPLSDSIDVGEELIGAIRLRKFSPFAIDESTLAHAFDQVPLPFECSVTVEPIDSSKLEYSLRGKLNRDQFSKDIGTQSKVDATATAIHDLAFSGSRAFHMEWILILKRSSEKELREDLGRAARALSSVFEVYVETSGALPTYVASCLGADQHVPVIELSPMILNYLPICTFGEEWAPRYSTTSMPIHRTDGTLSCFDPFDPSYTAYNTIITGRTGSGKSVFGNILSSALLSSPTISMIKVDVGGSYKRECQRYHGTEVEFHLDEPSGIDPFALVEKPTKEVISVLAELLCALSIEEGETTVQKTIRSEFESAVDEYFKLKPVAPSLHHFVETNRDLPRSPLLRRFGKGGVFENAIVQDADLNFGRYVYFNFANIQGAANKDFSNGIMAAVIAYTNIVMTKLSTLAAKAQGKRLVFFCDETKFFIDKNSDFFLLTTANFRKFGHAVILAGQNIEDFFLKKDGSMDRGLILNSFNRVFLATQCSGKFLKEEFGFDDRIVEILHSPGGGAEFRNVIIQDEHQVRSSRLYLSPEEYWMSTSSRSDQDRIASIKSQFNFLSERQVISILSMESGG